MTMNWSAGDTWYLAATWERIPGSFTANGDLRLMNNATGATQQLLGTWPELPNNRQAEKAPGDAAARRGRRRPAAPAGPAAAVPGG